MMTTLGKEKENSGKRKRKRRKREESARYALRFPQLDVHFVGVCGRDEA
jgi:hypothetical protein